MNVDIKKFKRIIEHNKILYAWRLNQDNPFEYFEITENQVVGLYLYLHFFSKLEDTSQLSKIPHIKLLRQCSRDLSTRDVFQLKLAKQLFEALEEQTFLILIRSYSSQYEISDIGKILKQEIKKCIEFPIDEEILWIKSNLLSNFEQDGRVNENFITIYLDFLYNGGQNV
ncbi:MAG: hypothetical protein ACOC3V_04055 [bacterium]